MLKKFGNGEEKHGSSGLPVAHVDAAAGTKKKRKRSLKKLLTWVMTQLNDAYGIQFII